MSEIWKPQSKQVYQSWIDSIMNEASDELSSWEDSFIAAIQMKLDGNYNLTEGQAEKLEQIYCDKVK